MNYDKEDFKIDLETNIRIVTDDITNGFRQGYLQALKNYENLILCEVNRSLPKVCIGCGSLGTEVIDPKYLACCHDNKYIPLDEYLMDSKYTKPTKFKR